VEDHFRLGAKRMDSRGSCHQGSYHRDTSTFGPWMIIKHPTHGAFLPLRLCGVIQPDKGR
jgi:hypothetical protein